MYEYNIHIHAHTHTPACTLRVEYIFIFWWWYESRFLLLGTRVSHKIILPFHRAKWICNKLVNKWKCDHCLMLCKRQDTHSPHRFVVCHFHYVNNGITTIMCIKTIIIFLETLQVLSTILQAMTNEWKFVVTSFHRKWWLLQINSFRTAYFPLITSVCIQIWKRNAQMQIIKRRAKRQNKKQQHTHKAHVSVHEPVFCF